MTHFSIYRKEDRARSILEVIVLIKGFQEISYYLKNERGTILEWSIVKHAMLNYIEEPK